MRTRVGPVEESLSTEARDHPAYGPTIFDDGQTYIYVYIYIQVSREKDTHIHTHNHIRIHIYIYTYRQLQQHQNYATNLLTIVATLPSNALAPA